MTRRVRASIAACVIVFGGLVLARNAPERSRFFPACPIREWTGLYCSGCGSTRAMHHLLNGRIGTAMTYNPLAVIAIPILGVMSGWPDRFRRPWISTSAVAILISYSILRNVDCWPFRHLAPPSPAISAISDTNDSFVSRSGRDEGMADDLTLESNAKSLEIQAVIKMREPVPPVNMRNRPHQ